MRDWKYQELRKEREWIAENKSKWQKAITKLFYEKDGEKYLKTDNGTEYKFVKFTGSGIKLLKHSFVATSGRIHKRYSSPSLQIKETHEVHVGIKLELE